MPAIPEPNDGIGSEIEAAVISSLAADSDEEPAGSSDE